MLEPELVFIPGGTFLMGSPSGFGCADEHPQHLVTVAPFWMGKYPVTHAQWNAVMALRVVNRELTHQPYFHYLEDPDLPVEFVTWYDAVEFCDRLSRHTGKAYRLPTEAEWEYACRAGTGTLYYFGETLTHEQAQYGADEPVKVGSFPPNAWGLYDIHGNVCEWCQDGWEPPEWMNYGGDTLRILRGGSWYDEAEMCRSAYRYALPANNRDNDIGFRVAVSP